MTPAGGAFPIETSDAAASELRNEGGRFGRYLLRRLPSESAVERYADASSKIFEPPLEQDRALMGFVARHPWSLAPLDAACGLLAPHSLLRKKLFLMLAILETVPRHSTVFMSRPSSLPGVFLRLAWFGVLSVLLVLGGIPLFFLARRAR